MPGIGQGPGPADDQTQALGAERPAIVDQVQAGSVKDQPILPVAAPLVSQPNGDRGAEAPVHHHLGRPVFEDAGVRPFAADQGLGQEGEAPSSPADRVLPADDASLVLPIRLH